VTHTPCSQKLDDHSGNCLGSIEQVSDERDSSHIGNERMYQVHTHTHTHTHTHSDMSLLIHQHLTFTSSGMFFWDY
jgi:hypothetical protein